jgi:hypothetical protein
LAAGGVEREGKITPSIMMAQGVRIFNPRLQRARREAMDTDVRRTGVRFPHVDARFADPVST